jgi:pimeloyl-ACP methyl ester carboxylesterase
MSRTSICTLAIAAGTILAVSQMGFAEIKVTLKPCRLSAIREELRCGVYPVFENRRMRRGRTLPLKIVLIPAHRPHVDQGPVFYLTGGPGEAATEMAGDMIDSIDRDEHDLVLMDERGTGDGHRLDCPVSGAGANLDEYLRDPFDPVAAHTCSVELERRFDLSQYSTAAFVEDLDEVRQAMGYDKINLDGGSFGTYAALMYIRRHGDHVRTAYLASLDTLSNRVPLNLARDAQQALDRLFAYCDQDKSCHAAYPRLADDFTAVLNRVRASPVLTWAEHPVTHVKTEVHLSDRAFTDAVRVLMYHAEARDLPFLIKQAKNGDFTPFADAAVRTIRGFYSDIRMGLFYAVSCNEFVDRIRPEEVEPATHGTYLGSWRVRDQIAACAEWPKTDLPRNYFEPFSSTVPMVLVSGDSDPAIAPYWAEELKAAMPNAIHVIVPGGGHTADNTCTRAIRGELFRAGSTYGLRRSCLTTLRPPPFKLPARPF